MNGWQRWLQAPQTHWLRRALFQVHLWAGIALGLYVLVISLSGSALLLKYRFYQWFEPKVVVSPSPDAVALTGDALTQKMAEVYAGYELGFTVESVDRVRATYIVLNKDGKILPHYFDQFSGKDLGPANPWPIRAIEALADVHAELLLGRNVGRKVNGVGGAVFLLMSLTGLVIWWQGRARWYEGFIINPFSNRSLWWQVHTFVGFWALLLMVAWGVSGFQLGFPRETNAIVNFFNSDPADNLRSSRWLFFFRAVHFARFGDTSLTRWLWIIASFLPTLMVLSGIVVWWRRVIAPRLRRRTLAAN
ncbi:MAG TPA: PepSY-associated TM helix domain-containing protein [Candidatus Acidoferrum sp.]|nr:PepSY-associated TM helix domain-containing protein [Candidatus Acidoferrum sp.]